MPAIELILLNGALWWLALLFLLLLGGLTYYSYKYITAIADREKLLLTIIRSLVILSLCLALVQMVVMFNVKHKQKNHVAVLIDASASMALPLSGSTDSRFARALALAENDIIPALGSEYNVDTYSFGDTIQLFDIKKEKERNALAPTAPLTDIPLALRHISAQAGLQPTAGVILISDGQNTSAGNPADAALSLNAQEIPVFAYEFSDADVRDVAVAELQIPEEIPVDKPAQFNAVLFEQGFDGSALNYEWSADGQVFSAGQIAGGGSRRITASWTPHSIGVKKIELRVRPLNGEITTVNNYQAQFVRVVKNQFKTLMVWGTPSWDYKFLYRCFDDDRNMSLTTIINGRPGSLSALQQYAGRLSQFDMVVLGNISADVLGTQFMENLGQFVSGRGGALLVIGGNRSFNLGNYQNSPLKNVLPIEWGTGGIYDSPFTLSLTPTGMHHAVMRLNDSAEANQQIWSSLPPIEQANVITRVKSGTEILAVHPTRKDIIIVAVGRYGLGKVGIFTGIGSWKWSFVAAGSGQSGDYYKQFWRQFARYLMSSRTQQVSVYTDKFHYSRGETVRIYATLFTQDFQPVANAHPVAQIVRMTNGGFAEVAQVALANTRVNPEQYAGLWTAAENGEYRVRLTMDHPQASGTSESPFLVQYPGAEYRRLGIDGGMLGQLARASGGTLFTEQTVNTIKSHLKPKQRRIIMTTTIEFWNSLPFLLITVALLAAEWIIRKMRGLL